MSGRRGRKRFARAVREMANADAPTLGYRNCTVLSVSSAAGLGGADLAMVRVDGSTTSIPVPYLCRPAPVQGSTVGVLFVAGSPVILGIPTGFTPDSVGTVGDGDTGNNVSTGGSTGTTGGSTGTGGTGSTGSTWTCAALLASYSTCAAVNASFATCSALLADTHN